MANTNVRGTIVDSQPPQAQQQQQQQLHRNREMQGSRGYAIAAVIAAIPPLVYAFFVLLILAFIILAVIFNYKAVPGFIDTALHWVLYLLIAVGGIAIIALARWMHNMYHDIRMAAHERSIAKHERGVAKAEERAAVAAADAAEREAEREKLLNRKAELANRRIEIQNEQLELLLDMTRQNPLLLKYAMDSGHNIKTNAKGDIEITSYLSNLHALQTPKMEQIAGPAAEPLPTSVKYEEVRESIPSGHALLGVDSKDVVTCAFRELMTMWICGGSNTGKSNTIGIKMREAIENGRDLGILCIDYHAVKPDSLYNKIRVYENRFLMPVAKNEEQALEVLRRFLGEFTKRRSLEEAGADTEGWRDILLVIDEVPAVLDSEDEEVVQLLKRIARICGRESRGFGMFGWFISQNAVGLAWLRNVVLTVIAHKMLMLNEAILACNQHQDIARDMENWPTGRVVVYGINFQGVKVLQMPVMTEPPAQPARVVSADPDRARDDTAPSSVVDTEEDIEDSEAGIVDADETSPCQQNGNTPVPALSGDLRKVYDAVQQMIANGEKIEARGVGRLTGFGKDKANLLLNRLEDMGYISKRKAV